MTACDLVLALYLATAVADGAATYQCLHARSCQELNPVLRSFDPTPLVAVKAVFTAGAMVGFWKARTHHPKLVMVLTGALVGVQAASVIAAVRSRR